MVRWYSAAARPSLVTIHSMLEMSSRALPVLLGGTPTLHSPPLIVCAWTAEKANTLPQDHPHALQRCGRLGSPQVSLQVSLRANHLVSPLVGPLANQRSLQVSQQGSLQASLPVSRRNQRVNQQVCPPVSLHCQRVNLQSNATQVAMLLFLMTVIPSAL